MTSQSNPVYCSMIHGGLQLDLKDRRPFIQSCCLRKDKTFIEIGQPFWPNEKFVSLQTKNLLGQWDKGCDNCHNLEKTGSRSFRQGMNDGLNIFGQTDLSGPARIDIIFDISCNLACRTCGPHSSTFWQKHLKEIGEWKRPIFSPRKRLDILAALGTLNLENLKQVVFCGGETLLGQEYWEVARWLVKNVPDAKQNLTLCFQTNGTQTINEKYYDVIERCRLVKLHVSIDDVGQRFEYLRWPANWEQLVDNLHALKGDLPCNVMFLIEQTISVFNVLSLSQVDDWSRISLNSNREGDPVDITRHLANGGFGLDHISQELRDRLTAKSLGDLISPQWQEKPDRIRSMLDTIKKFDHHRDQSFEKVFPEVFDCFKRFW